MFDNIFNENQMIQLQSILRTLNHTITFAESCTGGLCATLATRISGSSDIFRGSVVTYCNDIKEQELGVKKQTMIDFGAVSVQTVQEMLDGVIEKFEANCAIAISGVAGPNGGTPNKPVGTVVIGIKVVGVAQDIAVYQFQGTRSEVQMQAAKTAFLKIFKIYSKNS